MTNDEITWHIEALQKRCNRLEKENVALRIRAELDYKVNADLVNAMNTVIAQVQAKTQETLRFIDEGMPS